MHRGTQIRLEEIKGSVYESLNCPSFGPQNKNFKGFNKCNNQG